MKIFDRAQEFDIIGSATAAEIAQEFEGCRLCWAVSGGGQRFPSNVVLNQSDGYFLIPALGTLVPGYVLLVSRTHKGSTATLSRSELYELDDQLSKLLVALRAISANWLWFEHGTTVCEGPKACCVDHLHLHLVPLDFDLASEIAERTSAPIKAIASLTEINTALPASPSNYILIGNPDGRKYIISPQMYPSQYVRQIIAAKMRCGELWNWRTHPLEDRSLQTIKAFRAAGLSRRCIYFAHAIEGLEPSDVLSEVHLVRRAFSAGCPDVQIASMFELLEHNIRSWSDRPQLLVKAETQFLASCDAVVVDVSRPRWQYVGALMEVVYASVMHIPVIAIVGQSDIKNRRWLQAHATIVENVEEAANMARRMWQM